MYALSFPINCFSGQQSILKCYGEIFSETLCTWPTFIQIQSADYGKTTSSDATICNPDEKVCWQDVQEVNPTYYHTILNACNGNRACVNLIADWTYLPECDNILSDYVELFYRCVTGEFTPLTLDWECMKQQNFVNYILNSYM